MCYEIDSEVILANILKKKAECSLGELVEIKSQLEKEFPSVYVDVTRNSVFATIETYPKIFCWMNEKIHRGFAFSENENLVTYFNEDLNDKIKESFKKFIENYEVV